MKASIKDTIATCAVTTAICAAAACGVAVQTPASVPTDIGDAIACVVADLIAAKPPTDCVEKFGLALVNDALQTLLDSKSFAAQQPKAAAGLPKAMAELKVSR